MGPTTDHLVILPENNLKLLVEAVHNCRACPLHLSGTQAICGEGSKHAQILLVGEQPGDLADREGRPFSGPAGLLLDRCLEQAGVHRSDVYITNIVKHFNEGSRSRWRLRKKPNAREVAACRPWLDAELQTIQPKLVVCLGATAAQAFLGKSFRATRRRGEVIDLGGLPFFMATAHPSSILRMPDKTARHRATSLFIEDLREAALHLGRLHAA